MNTGGLTSRSAVRKLPPNAPAMANTTTEAIAWPNTTETRLNAPKPSPRRFAGMASDSPARSDGTARVMMNVPATSRRNVGTSGIRR